MCLPEDLSNETVEHYYFVQHLIRQSYAAGIVYDLIACHITGINDLLALVLRSPESFSRNCLAHLLRRCRQVARYAERMEWMGPRLEEPKEFAMSSRLSQGLIAVSTVKRRRK